MSDCMTFICTIFCFNAYLLINWIIKFQIFYNNVGTLHEKLFFFAFWHVLTLLHSFSTDTDSRLHTYKLATDLSVAWNSFFCFLRHFMILYAGFCAEFTVECRSWWGKEFVKELGMDFYGEIRQCCLICGAAERENGSNTLDTLSLN